MFNDSNRLRGVLRNMDIPLVFLTVITALFGILMISSAGGTRYVIIQSAAFFIGICGIVALMILDYEYLAQISLYLYAASVLLLILVLIPGLGAVRNGARSWFVLGPVNFQPAEVIKIAFIITFAKQLSENDSTINQPKTLLKLLAHLGILCVLILLQPDFGTASVFICIALVMLFTAKISWKYVAGGAAVVAAACPLLWFFVLQDYQKSRIISVFNPEQDPMGTGYHVIQSKIAVGSGKIFGTGLYKGSSQVNNLLPERHTDFIYSVVCEELGMIGAVLVILLLTLIILRCIYIGMNARNSLGTYICTGVAAMLIFQVFENIGMCLGLFPVTGITLPFFSYGGSSLVTTMLAIGLVLNVRYRCRMINF
ncbi:rod shape-determining protein RodA [Ructibacterium gallinarum]|uniref:Rod shape-determining protein RodA n=1 Tax=Ructibacterium gallinarum TaxID=2779355 RepID=A0A9D5M1X3_9FIRM|nr:rod shape-determining protein RodA [Ructibacterium gallinarum]MBE5039923.1 rod shape-determining protein RodA [Ructibacterium gallinarum]